MPESEKRDRLCDVLNDENTGQCLIFVRTKRRADALAKFMQTCGFAIDALHGDMRQGLRQRVLRNFRDGKLQALIATDVAARGIDVAGLSHVVNFDLTDTLEAYIHRIGRTGRAGLGGLAISFCSPSEEPRLAAIISVVGARVELFDLAGGPVTNFQANPAPRKRVRPPRARRDNGRSEQNTGSRQRRDAKQKDGKRTNLSERQQAFRAKDVAGWSPVVAKIVALRGGLPVGRHAHLQTPNRDIEKTANQQTSLLRKPEQLMSAGQNGLIGLSAMTGHNMTSDPHVMKGPRVISGQSVMIGMPIKTARHSLKKVANPHLPRILALTHSPNPRPEASPTARHLTVPVASPTADHPAKSRIANRVATTRCGVENNAGTVPSRHAGWGLFLDLLTQNKFLNFSR